jgi:hypothetical protein
MMKIFICPGCGRMTAASRKKEVFCSRCGELPMERSRITFEKYAAMDDGQRIDYAKSWMYIHAAGKKNIK